MKKLYFMVLWICCSVATYAQTPTTETFETESAGSTTFTDNGVIFNITSNTSTFKIANYPGTGWNGTANDNRYIDNTGYVGPANASFRIKTTSNLFKVKSFWIYTANNLSNQNTTGTLSVVGKLNGTTKFAPTKSSGFATTLGATNGYTLIDMTNLNGQNYSNIVIDELQLTLGGNFYYLAFDAFTWVKDSNVVLATGENTAARTLSLYPNPAAKDLNFNLQESQTVAIYSMDGKLVQSAQAQKGDNKMDVSALPAGTYLLKAKEGNRKFIKK